MARSHCSEDNMTTTSFRLALALATVTILGGGLGAMAATIGTPVAPTFTGELNKECTLVATGSGADTMTQNLLVLASPTDAVQISATSNLIDETTGAAAVVFSVPADLVRTGGYGSVVPANAKAMYVDGVKKTAAFAIDLADDGSLAATDLGVEFTLSSATRWPAGIYSTSSTVTCTDDGAI